MGQPKLAVGAALLCVLLLVSPSGAQKPSYQISEDENQIQLVTDRLEAGIRKKGYVSGVFGGTFQDKKTGFRDAGHGLSIADFILEPGSDEAYRDRIEPTMFYQFDTPEYRPVHGKIAKHYIEGPQICTKAKQLEPRVIRGRDFVAVTMTYRFPWAAPGRKAGSLWTQTMVFPAGKRYYLCSQRIDSVNSSPAMFFRIDMPGHIKHKQGDTFSEVYLSYLKSTNGPHAFKDETIPASAFFENFAPDEKFYYRRDGAKSRLERFIRAYRLRDPKTGAQGPWLAGMTLDPTDVYEAWCHQRGYVCMIEEFGGRPIKPGEAFSAAFVVGYFDSVEEMNRVYDEYKGHSGLTVDESGWKLTR
jgi:hypothetical protein